MKKLFEKYPLWLVFIFTAISLLSIMILRDFSPDNELRYLSIADEALRDGHFFAFFNQGMAYADKPPLYFWIIMLCKLLIGKHSMFALSLFSFIPALVITWVMDKWVRLESPAERAALALMNLTGILFLGISVFLRMDLLMVMFIVLALYSFHLWYSGKGSASIQSWLFPIWVFMALFTKGPVGFLVPPVSISVFLLLRGEGKKIWQYLGGKSLVILLLLSGLWFTAVYLEGGKDYLNNLLFHQTVDRAVNAFHHKKPFWYYIPALLYSLAPWSVLLCGSLLSSFSAGSQGPLGRHGIFGNKGIFGGRGTMTPPFEIGGNNTELSERKDDFKEWWSLFCQKPDIELLFLSVIISTFVMLSAFSSKLAIYLVPIFPFMVWLFPMVLAEKGWKKWMSWSLAIPAAIIALAGIAGLVGIHLLRDKAFIADMISEMPFLTSLLVSIAMIILSCGGVLAIRMIINKKAWSLPVFIIASSILLCIYSVSSLIPKANDYTGYGSVCSQVPEDSRVATLFVRRAENMDVYLGRDIIDYKKDFAAFYKEQIENRKSSDSPISLIVPESKLFEVPELQTFASTNLCHYSGSFVIITVK